MVYNYITYDDHGRHCLSDGVLVVSEYIVRCLVIATEKKKQLTDDDDDDDDARSGCAAA